MRALILCCLVWSACESANAPPQPEEPVWGKQQCGHCAMLVSEKAPAAQAVLANGQRKFFDDVGCLVAWEAREQPTLSAHWVRGPGAVGWVAPEQTRFQAGQPTPMDYGFVAATDGITFDEVRVAVAQKTRGGPAR